MHCCHLPFRRETAEVTSEEASATATAYPSSVRRASPGDGEVEEKAWGNYVRGAAWALMERYGSSAVARVRGPRNVH